MIVCQCAPLLPSQPQCSDTALHLTYVAFVGTNAHCLQRSSFETSLPQNCTSIAAIRKTTRVQLRKLPFDLSAEDIRAVLDALKTEPLDTQLASSQGDKMAENGADQEHLDEESVDDAKARRRRLLAGGGLSW